MMYHKIFFSNKINFFKMLIDGRIFIGLNVLFIEYLMLIIIKKTNCLLIRCCSLQVDELKEVQNPVAHVQEHDLKGAASLFTLTNYNT